MFLGKVSRAILDISRIMWRGWTTTRSPSMPRPKASNCRTISLPRWALTSMVSTSRSKSASGNSCIRSKGADIMMGARMLFRSWATPPARVPMLSMRCARRNWFSSRLFSVMSELITRTEAGWPASSRTKVQRVLTMTSRPLRANCFSSPFHSPLSRSSVWAASNCLVSRNTRSVMRRPRTSAADQP